MKKYFISNNTLERKEFISQSNNKKIAIYNKISIKDIENNFDKTYKLLDLYKDELFLTLLSEVNNEIDLFLIDLGLDYCSFQANYIKPYTKLHPLSLQAKNTYIIDNFAFYNTEKAIYRPFLYLDPNILESTVSEFYNIGIYKDFEGNKIENYYKKIKPYIDIKIDKIKINTIFYAPTEKEIKEYENLKEKLIFKDKLPKIAIINKLFKYINNTDSKKKSIRLNNSNIAVTDNSKRENIYKNIISHKMKEITFYSSKYYGIDELELNRTRGAIIRHNELITLLNG